MPSTYILNGKLAVECDDPKAWAEWIRREENRRVASDTVDGVWVSTIFLGSDHSIGCGPPLLFETMVFGGPMDQEQSHCSTWEEAETMHAEMVAKVKRKTAKGERT